MLSRAEILVTDFLISILLYLASGNKICYTKPSHFLQQIMAPG